MLNSLQIVIIENAPIINSYQNWINKNEHNDSLREIADKLLGARAEVSELNLRGLEMPECGVVLLSESICRVLNGSNLWPQNYSSLNHFFRNSAASSKVKINDFHKAAGKESYCIDHGHGVNRFAHSCDVQG